jgi:hypothetical protein
MLTRAFPLHALGRPQGEWPPRLSKRRRLLIRQRRRNPRTLLDLLAK